MLQDRAVSLFLLALSIFFCISSLSLGIGSLQNPGAGFVPFFSGLLLGCLSLVLLFMGTEQTKTSFLFRRSWLKCSWVVGSLLFYFFFIEKLGFIFTAFVTIFVLFSLQNKNKMVVFLIALFTVFLSYVIFQLWLGVRLPKGVIGI